MSGPHSLTPPQADILISIPPLQSCPHLGADQSLQTCVRASNRGCSSSSTPHIIKDPHQRQCIRSS